MKKLMILLMVFVFAGLFCACAGQQEATQPQTEATAPATEDGYQEDVFEGGETTGTQSTISPTETTQATGTETTAPGTETTAPGTESGLDDATLALAKEYEAYQAMDGNQKKEYRTTRFGNNNDAFFNWYNAAMEAYKLANPPTEIGPDGVIDLG